LSLWNFALVAWGRPGVSEACLRLQDDSGQCAPLLLWRAWAAGEGRDLDAAALGAGVELARAWEGMVTGPLRAARRALKSPFAGLDAAGRAALACEVRTAELAAERLLLEALEAATPAGGGAAADVADALAELARAWNGGATEGEVRALALALA
jgi:uncharacterized protein (TIGR02444 family)